MINFLTDENTGSHSLILFPRGHSKSTIMAFYIVWRIVKDPCITILYASATSALSEVALAFIKQTLDSDIMKKYFPELLHKDEGKRTKWSQTEIKVDHPIRKQRGIRDATIYATGAGKNITGLHFDMLVLDDIIAPNTEVDPFSSVGRDKTRRWVSFVTSILNAGGEVRVVGTRYHADDIYNSLINMEEPVFDKEGNIIETNNIYSILEEKVEIDGQFLFPRKKGKDGKYYGFDSDVLNKIKAQYLDTSQFYAQYYNEIRDPDNAVINREQFQYYEPSNLNYILDRWQIGNKLLNIYAAVDFAVSVAKRADYTAIVVVGIDTDGLRYILDIRRLKTNKISEIADVLLSLYSKWKFIRLRAEINAQQGALVRQLQEFMRQRNAIFSWDEVRYTRNKEERILSVLEPLYAQKIIFHFKGGNCEILEDELLSPRSQHDDIADALASCCEMALVVPRKRFIKEKDLKYHPLFGGVI